MTATVILLKTLRHICIPLAALSLIFASTIAQSANYTITPKPASNPPQVNFEPTRAYVEQYIVQQAVKNGVDPKIASWIVSHESQDDYRYGKYDPAELGDDGNSIGSWQISIIWHPEVPVTCSGDLVCSTAWAMKELKAGRANEWSTFRLCRKLYKDCPF